MLPCSCDPCTCGDTCSCQGADAYVGPRWRLTGEYIESGVVHGIDLSHRTVLHFAQTSHEKAQDWQEAILLSMAGPWIIRVLARASGFVPTLQNLYIVVTS